MTLALALKCADGLVMAADSRASSSTTRVDYSQKFLQVNRDVGIMTYGLTEPGYRGMRAVVEHVREDPASLPSMKAIVDKAKELMTRERDNFLQETEDALKAASDPNADEIMQQYRSETVGYIIGGFDGNDTGTFQVFHAASDWAFEMYKQENDILAAQFPLPTILLPYLRYSGISVREGAKIATLLMILTEMHEDSVGGPIHLATVSYTEGFNLLHNREVAALVNEVQPVLDGIRRSLVDAWFLTDFQSQAGSS